MSVILVLRMVVVAVGTAVAWTLYTGDQRATDTAREIFDRIDEYVRQALASNAPEDVSQKPRGFFPQGCMWMPVDGPSSMKHADSYPPTPRRLKLWRLRSYKYYDEQTRTWSAQQPEACGLTLKSLRGENPGQEVPVLGEMRRTKVEKNTNNEYTVIHNVWYSNGHFYSVSDAEPEFDVRVDCPFACFA